MFSVTYTGMNLFPLCTAKVCPTKSGITVLARDHVLTTRFSLREFIEPTRFSRLSWTNGPFFTLLAIVSGLGYNRLLRRFAALPAAHDEPLGRLLGVARLHALLLAPRADDVAAAARAPAVRVVDGIHHLAAHLRPLPEPPALPGLAVREQLVLGVPHLADRRQAVAVHQAHLGGRHAQRHVLPLLRHHGHRGAGRAGHLPPLPHLQLHVVHRGAERHLAQRERVPVPDVRA